MAKTITFATLGLALGITLNQASAFPPMAFNPCIVKSTKGACHDPTPMPDPIDLCHRALNASLNELDKLNQAAGMKPHSPFSIDDYCGHECGTNNQCLNDCRACLDDATGKEIE